MRNFIRQCVVAYTVSQNTHHSVVTVISSNLKPIFKILSLLENLLNFQQNSMTAHYLEKLALELPHCRRRAVFVNVVFSDENVLITNVYQLTGHKATELVNKSPDKWWTKSNINRLLKKVKRHWHSQRQTTKSSAALQKMLTWLTTWF